MELRWLSPLHTNQTEIAKYSRHVLGALSECTSKVSVSSGADAEEIPEWAQQYPAATEQQMNDTAEGISIYHIGNNKLHVDIVRRLRQQPPGIVVLHEICLIGLAKACTKVMPDFSWKRYMAEHYGLEALRIAELSLKSEEYDQELVTRYPLFQPFVENAAAVIVHSEYAKEIISPHYSGPVFVLNLPYPSSTSAPAPPQQDTPDKDIEQPLTIAFCGHAGPNRKLHTFIKAWGQIDSPERFRLELMGHIGNTRPLVEAAEESGVREFVSFRGFVTEEDLHTTLASADLAINLRYPTMGETSSSQLRLWDMALPTLVTNVGWYSEIPADLVCHVEPDNAVEDIKRWLNEFLLNPEKFATMGDKARDYVGNHHPLNKYAEDVRDIAMEYLSHRFNHKFLYGTLAETIGALCADESDARIFDSAAKILTETFEGKAAAGG